MRNPIEARTRTAAMAGAAVLLVALAAGATAADCPDSFTGLASLAVGKSIDCTCGPDQLSGSVWGTGRYTGDSSLCAAARHAGAIGTDGGRVTVYRCGACPAVVGSTRNGIESRDWGPYDLTFAFTWPAPSCRPSPEASALPRCPATMGEQGGRRTAEPLECACAASQVSGNVWGSEPYTFDSSICAAARHAGVIDTDGGEVLVFAARGCASFKGSTRHGVTSADWGPYQDAFAFRYPLPACSDGARLPKRR